MFNRFYKKTQKGKKISVVRTNYICRLNYKNTKKIV